MLTLGIETSCDETSAAVVDSGRHTLSNVILSQIDHVRFGGVVPEVASRAHLRTIVPVYREALAQAGIGLDRIELIAATMGPGLVGPLLVGLTFAKGLAFATGTPFVAVNHIEGHIAANMLSHQDLERHHLALIVSGGHTLLVEIESFGKYHVLGRTKDDAVGEAFDKVAKLMGLGYPGGARLDRLAASGDPKYHRFPRPLKGDPGFDFSYSGLKTAVALHLARLDDEEIDRHRADLAAAFQEAALEPLVERTVRAVRERGLKHVTLSGGVAANSRLRTLLDRALQRAGGKLFAPPLELCTDNAAMIAAAGLATFEARGPSELTANATPYLDLVD